MVTKKEILEKLKELEEPCMPLVNIVDMGLIYDVEVIDDCAKVLMTFTSKLCPASFRLTKKVEEKVKELGFEQVNVELTFDPPWTPDRLSEENRRKLGFI